MHFLNKDKYLSDMRFLRKGKNPYYERKIEKIGLVKLLANKNRYAASFPLTKNINGTDYLHANSSYTKYIFLVEFCGFKR